MKDSILLSLQLPLMANADLNEELEEMSLLAATLGFHIINVEIQRKSTINPKTYFGSGKIKDLFNKITILGIDTVFVNDELSPTHFRNIQKILGEGIYLIDRTKLILDIFNLHAKTNEAKSQIRLATLEYLLPRLVGQWTHLERQIGGTGIRGGPGEKQIEIDRRLARNEISALKKQLDKIQSQRITQSKARKNIYKIALAGYTNSGKSTLLKQLTGYNTLIKDQLFATLDTTTKQLKLPNRNKVLISDTVGFLRKLPHSLIASFRSTLSVIKESDLILKIIDINSSDLDGHISTIDNTLKLLGCDKNDSILVFNKIDLVKNKSLFEKINKKYNKPLMVSALKDIRINELLTLIEDKSTSNYYDYTLMIPQSKNNLIKELYKEAIVKERKDTFEYIEFKIKATKKFYNKISILIS